MSSILGIMERKFRLGVCHRLLDIFLPCVRSELNGHSELSPLNDVALTTFPIINRKVLQNNMFLNERLTAWKYPACDDYVMKFRIEWKGREKNVLILTPDCFDKPACIFVQNIDQSFFFLWLSSWLLLLSFTSHKGVWL